MHTYIHTCIHTTLSPVVVSQLYVRCRLSSVVVDSVLGGHSLGDGARQATTIDDKPRQYLQLATATLQLTYDYERQKFRSPMVA